MYDITTHGNSLMMVKHHTITCWVFRCSFYFCFFFLEVELNTHFFPIFVFSVFMWLNPGPRIQETCSSFFFVFNDLVWELVVRLIDRWLSRSTWVRHSCSPYWPLTLPEHMGSPQLFTLLTTYSPGAPEFALVVHLIDHRLSRSTWVCPSCLSYWPPTLPEHLSLPPGFYLS